MVIQIIIVIVIKNFYDDNNNSNSKTLKHNFPRIFTLFAAQIKRIQNKQIVITIVFLNLNLTEDVHIKQPEGHPDYNKTFLTLSIDLLI